MNIQEISPRAGTAFARRKGEVLRVIDPRGIQVSDMLAFAAADVREVSSAGRTFDYEETIGLTTCNRIGSNRSDPLLEFVEDTVDRRGFLLMSWSKGTFCHFYPNEPVHRGRFGNLAEALAPYWIEPDAILVAFNIFMNVQVGGDTGNN